MANFVLAILVKLVNLVLTIFAISTNLDNLVITISVNLVNYYYPKDKKIFHRNETFNQNFNRFQKIITKYWIKNFRLCKKSLTLCKKKI